MTSLRTLLCRNGHGRRDGKQWALLAVLADADSFVEIARFGAMKLAFLRRFRPFADGTPSYDHLGDIFAALDADQFQRCFADWVALLIGVPAGVVAIDGKTVRRFGGKAGKGAIHMVSAFAAGQRLVLGQVKLAEKFNEIVALSSASAPPRSLHPHPIRTRRDCFSNGCSAPTSPPPVGIGRWSRSGRTPNHRLASNASPRSGR